MIKISLKTKNGKPLGRNISEEIAAKINNAVLALKEATPVDTGNARDSWKYENGSIINTAEYIENLNEGSSTQAPARFIEQTLLTQEGISPSGTIVRSL